MVFIPRPVPAQETWTGHMITAAEARETSGIQDVFESSQFNGFLGALIPRAPRHPCYSRGRHGRGGRGAANAAPPANTPTWTTEFAKPIEYAAKQELQVYMILPARPNAVEYRREQEFAGKLASVGAGVHIKDASTLFGNLRRVKSQREIDILQHAVDITAEAFQRAYAVALPGTP
jgi:Xaa-Pro aminopeptidase